MRDLVSDTVTGTSCVPSLKEKIGMQCIHIDLALRGIVWTETGCVHIGNIHLIHWHMNKKCCE